VELPPPERLPVITCDVSQIAHPDETALDTLVRLQLAAHRAGATLRLHNACPVLVDLIDCAGLADVLVVVPSGGDDGSAVAMDRQAEHREEVGVDEEVLRDDDAV
jgi:hypothetical protein